MIHRLVVPLTFAAVVLFAAQALAQGAFPAPLPDQAAQGNASPAPWVSGAIPFSSAGGALAPFERRAPDGCGQGFAPLREEAEKRGKLIKAASDRRAPPDEACKLIMGFGQAEIKMIKYVQTNAVKCGISPQIADQLKTGHANTEKMQRQVCNVAEQAKGRAAAGPVGDFWPASRREPAGPVGDFPIIR